MSVLGLDVPTEVLTGLAIALVGFGLLVLVAVICVGRGLETTTMPPPPPPPPPAPLVVTAAAVDAAVAALALEPRRYLTGEEYVRLVLSAALPHCRPGDGATAASPATKAVMILAARHRGLHS